MVQGLVDIIWPSSHSTSLHLHFRLPPPASTHPSTSPHLEFVNRTTLYPQTPPLTYSLSAPLLTRAPSPTSVRPSVPPLRTSIGVSLRTRGCMLAFMSTAWLGGKGAYWN